MAGTSCTLLKNIWTISLRFALTRLGSFNTCIQGCGPAVRLVASLLFRFREASGVQAPEFGFVLDLGFGSAGRKPAGQCGSLDSG